MESNSVCNHTRESDDREAVVRFVNQEYDYRLNHKNYNFLACDWFKNVQFSTNSLAKLLSDSLLLDSLLLDSFNKPITFKDVITCARAVAFVFALDLRAVYASFVSILLRIFSFFITSLFYFFSEIVIFMINW